MRIGIVVDGVAEYASLPLLLPRIGAVTGHTYLPILKADIQPYAPLPAIGRTCKQPVIQLLARGAEIVLVVFDRESRLECPPEIARRVESEIRRHVACNVAVVVKNRTFENWLAADLAALRTHPVRFQVARRHERRVEPNRADEADATVLLKSTINGDYEKVGDAKRILNAADAERMGMHSRSFRRFLRAAGHPRYLAQSKLPVPPR